MALTVLGEVSLSDLQAPVVVDNTPAPEATPNPTHETAPQANAPEINTPAPESIVAPETNIVPESNHPEVIDYNNVSFTAPNFEEKEKEQEQKTTTWKDAIKEVKDKREVLEALGLNPFVIEMAEYIEKGGNPADYVTTQAVDYKQYSHEQLIKDELKAQYPHLSSDKLQKLYEAEYKQGENHDDDEKEVGAIRMEAKGEEIRQKRIAEQSARKIPETPQPKPSPEQQKVIAESEKFMGAIRNHPAVATLRDFKGVNITLPDGKEIFAKIDDPNFLWNVALGQPDTIMKLAKTQGEPDASLLLQNAIHRINPSAYNAAIYNKAYHEGLQKGKEQGLEEGKKKGEDDVVNKDRNVGFPARTNQQANTNATYKEALKTVKTVSLNQLLNN